MAESRRRAMEDRLLQQWKEIEDLEAAEEAEDQFKTKKEQWFLQAFSFLRDLPEESHCWCGHKEIMLPLLEPFYSYFHETSPNSSLKVLWRRLSKEMRGCTRCVVQHHKGKEFYVSEFVEEVVKPLLDIIRALDEERVAEHMKELVDKFNTLDTKEDSQEVICVMFEVLMYPFLLDDAEINETVGPFLLHVEETHDLSLAAGQRYPGVYSLLLHKDQGVRRIAGKLAQSLPTFKDEHDMESIEPMLGKCMNCLEYDSFGSTLNANHGRPRASFTREALWIGLTTLLNFLEPPAFLKGVMEKYPTFVSIVLNHISEVTPVFWNALRCLKLLLEVLKYKLWLGTTFSPGVMRNTLLSQCFHSREERLHIHIFDLFPPFLTSLEALQDGEYENQRRRLLYFLLQQVPLSSNFKPLVTKKARQVAFSIIGRGYTMDPPLPPVECVHFWGPPLVATLKDTSLIPSVKQSATDLIQSIIVADAAALAAVSIRQASGLQNSDKYNSMDDEDETAEETPDKGRKGHDPNFWISFLSVTRSVEATEQWFCLPLLWVDVLNGIMPRNLPLSFTKAMMWALSRLSMIDLEGMTTPKDLVVTSVAEVACSRDLFAAFTWVKPKGCEDGASGEGCVNAVKTAAHHEELVGVFKKHADKYFSHLRDAGFEQGHWAWEARMAEPWILIPLDANATFREFGKEVLRRVSNSSTLEAGLELLCSSEASCAAVSRGLHHALKQLLHWPLSRCSRELQQLFFHVWKLLTLGDKEQPERHASQLQGSQDGGFLNQPNFRILSLENSQSTPVNKGEKAEAAWRKLCTQVAYQLWPLLVKTIREGREHLEGAGQLMTFTRMLQLLPCVFLNLNATQKKNSFLGKNGSKAIPRQASCDVTWFHAFASWSDVASPIIQRWWKEAVASILEDLKGWELVLPLELEDLILDLRRPGQELDQQRRLRLTSLLQSVPTLVLSHQFLDRETNAAPLKRENAHDHNEVIELTDSPEASPSARVYRLNLHGDDPLSSLPTDAPDSFVKVSGPHNDIIDIPDSPEASGCGNVRSLDSHGDDPVPLSTLQRKQQGETDVADLSSSRKYDKSSDEGSGSLQNTSEKSQFDWPQRPQLHRPSNQKGTLDDYLAKFFTNKAEKESRKGGFQVQQRVRSNAFKLPPPSKSVPGKFQKAGGKLSSLRNEHREALEERSAVVDIVRNQVRERIEMEARAKQLTMGEQNHINVSAPYSLVPSGIPRAELKELVQDDEVDPLDAALDTVRKPRLGLTEPSLKPRRKLITLEMPGESGRAGGSLAKLKPGLVINPRQIPRLDHWYKQILSLDYLSVVGISDENSSPGSNLGERLEKVPLTFKSPEQYMSIFRPLVLEEFKSQLQRSHGEVNLSDATTAGILRLMSLERVDDFQVGRFVAEAGSDGAARACADHELILLSRQSLQSGPQSCHILAKMESRDRESKSRATVLLLKLYVPVGGDVRLSKAKRLLVDRSKWFMTRIMNITPQIREWQALSSLQSLPLLPVLLSPAAGYQVKDSERISSIAKLRCLPEPLQRKLRGDYNESQLRAIADSIGGKETMTNDHHLTLVQGPPGTGKTKTIVAILSVLLALRSSKRAFTTAGIDDQPPQSRSNVGTGGFNNAIKSSSRDAAAMSRAWQDAARAKEMMKESGKYSPDLQGQKQRVLVCAQSNAAVDEIVARICKNGLYGVDGKFFKPVVVRVGTLKSVHPRSLPVYIDTLVDQRLEGSSEKENDTEPPEVTGQAKLVASRSKLEEVIEFIQVIESLRYQSKDVEGEKIEQKAGVSESAWTEKSLKVIAMGESAVTGKLNLLYNQRRALTAEVATAEKEGKKAYEESKNMRKSIKRDIIRQADVVVTTLSGCGGDIYSVCMESLVGGNKKNKSVQECFFDAVVIDEAAQALEPATLIPLQLLVQTNARCVMVGDPKQLPATVLSQTASRMQYECSMFERLQRAGFPVTMLSTQYRMHPQIRQFPSAHFYDDLIMDGEGLTAARKAIFHREQSFGPYVFFNVVDGQETRKGSSASQSLSNQAEVSVAVHLYLALKKRYPAELWDGRVGVITPYKQQLRLLQEEFGRAVGSAGAAEIEFNTVDGFQGREVDILILTTVRASSSLSENSSKQPGGIGFVADVRRMNVALTRARFSLWIIGNAATLKANSSWASLLSNAERRAVIYSVQKPYGSFFQKSRLLIESSHSSRALKTSTGREDDHRANADLYNPAPLDGAPGRPTENRERDETNGAVVRKGDVRSPDHTKERTGKSSLENGSASEVRGQKAHQSNEHSRDRHGRSISETNRYHQGKDVSRERSRHGQGGGGSTTESRKNPSGENPSRESSRRSHTREDQSRESARHRHVDRRSTTDVQRNGTTGHDRVGGEGGPGGERNLGEDKRGKRLHQEDGYSGSKEKLELWSQLGKEHSGSGKDEEARMKVPTTSERLAAEVKQHERSSDRIHKLKEAFGNDREEVMEDTREGRSKSPIEGGIERYVEGRQDGPTGEENFGFKRRPEKEARIIDQTTVTDSNRNREEQNLTFGENRDGIDERHWRSRKERSHVRHRKLDEKGDDRRNISINSKDRNERKQPAGDEGVIFKQDQDSSRENRMRRTSQEELRAARKRKREQVDALLPSSLLMSSERSGGSPSPRDQMLSTARQGFSGPEQRARYSKVEAMRSKDEQKDLNNEWAKFEAALGKSESAVPVANNATADSAAGVPTKVLGMPRRDSKRPALASKQSKKPASDLDNILAGLSSVTWAQAKGGKMDAPPPKSKV